MLNCLARANRFPLALASSTVRGSFIKMNDKFYEVEKSELRHIARQAGFCKVDAFEVLTGKKESMQFSSNGKVEKIDTVKINTQVQYVDKASRILVLADEQFNTVEVPIEHCDASYLPHLDAGTIVVLIKDVESGDLVKCLFPSSLMMKAKVGAASR